MEAEYNRKTRLQKLKGSDFEIADGEPDIRGWKVRDLSGKKLGEVEELIFDFESLKVRYLIVDLEDNEYNIEDKEVLVPIGIAELHQDEDYVVLPGVSSEQLASLPVYDEDRFDTEHEGSVRNVFGGLGTAAMHGGSDQDEDFYNHDHFNTGNLYRNRARRSRIEQTDTTGSTSSTNSTNDDWQDINPGGVRLRSRSSGTLRDDTKSEGTGRKGDGTNEYPVM